MEQYEHCLGSSKYRICSEAFPTQIGHPSCIATFYFFSPIDVLAVCETTAITLPSIEQATNLGFGIWLIKSANADFTFRESSSLATSSSSRSFAGCDILARGMQMGIYTSAVTLFPRKMFKMQPICRSTRSSANFFAQFVSK